MRHPRGPVDPELAEEHEQRTGEDVGERQPPRVEVAGSRNDQQGYQREGDDLAVHDQQGRHEDDEAGD